MQITLENVLPIPLASQNLENSSVVSNIWQTTCNFSMGQTTQISAHSGKGKSSFIHFLYGIRNDYTGNIFLDNQNIQKFSMQNWANIRQSKIAIVFQDLRLFLHLTAEENLLVKANLTDIGKQKNIKKMAEKLQINHLLDKKTAFLSYGERQRIAIIRAVLQPFEVLLLDEPFSHLDKENIERAIDLLKDESEKNQATVLMTSLGYQYHWNFQNEMNL
ncbi:MAG: ATP-binding cassette domain-containing protein [Bacteroidetes bacterium]|nr:MAG: ATP-binding cassette domain-containing protein [Bacteroidota bacterium]TAG94735.1 MAG: ATP-binding cassette domain-containing protein [Bacteroidota bacterium]